MLAQSSRKQPPQTVSPETLHLFKTDGHPSPDISRPLLDWNSQFTTQWNALMLKELAIDFVRQVNDGEHKHVARGSVTLEAIRKDILTKLQDGRKNFKNHNHPELSPEECHVNEKIQNRRQGRRVNVSVTHHSTGNITDSWTALETPTGHHQTTHRQ